MPSAAAAPSAVPRPNPSTPPQPQQSADVLPPQNLKCGELKKWLESNYKHQDAASPNGAMPEYQVLSWMQVPHILEKLNSSSGQIRLGFPEKTPADPALAAEQKAIKDFLKSYAGKELKDLPTALKSQIENAAWFKAKKSQFSADDYLKNFNFSKSGTAKLTVTEVARATDKGFTPTKKGAPSMAAPAIKERDLVLGVVTEAQAPTPLSHRAFVVEVAENCAVVLAAQLKESIEDKKLDPAKLSHLKVWISPDSFNPATKLAEEDLLQFLKRAAAAPLPAAPKPKKTAGASAPLVVGSVP